MTKIIICRKKFMLNFTKTDFEKELCELNPKEMQKKPGCLLSHGRWKMKVLIQCLLLVVSLSGCAFFAIKQELKPQHADVCKRVSADSGNTAVLTTQDVQKKFKSFDESVELKHDYLICGKDKSKPPVILLHEMPGLGAETIDYAKTLAEDFTVYVPLLMGELYRDSFGSGLWDYLWEKEWEPQPKLGGSTLITQWLRKFVAEIAQSRPQQNVGIIGNCLTGALPLALLDNPQVTRIVLAQPVLPMRTMLGFGGEQDLAISDSEWELAKQRLNPNPMKYPPISSLLPAKAYGTRFALDTIAPIEKYEYLKRELGSGFLCRQITKAEYTVKDDDGKLLFEIPSDAHSSLIHGWQNYPKHPSAIRRQGIKVFLLN